MTNAVIEKPGNGAGLSTMSADMISKLVLHGDLSKMNDQEKTNYVLYRCQAVGLDPATKPFDLLTLQGKQVLYATKACTDQISKRDGLSSTIVKEEELKGVYKVTARISDASGRSTENVGCVTVESLKGNDYCNAIMKAHTKAIRRATLAHCGLGMLDESELETIKDVPVTVKQEAKEPLVVPDEPAKPVAAPAPEADKPTRKVEKGTNKRLSEDELKALGVIDAMDAGESLKLNGHHCQKCNGEEYHVKRSGAKAKRPNALFFFCAKKDCGEQKGEYFNGTFGGYADEVMVKFQEA